LNHIVNINEKPFIIAGPCSAESRQQTIETCCQLARTGRVDVLRAGVWKPRTKPGSFEGVGSVGLEWLAEVKQLTGLPVATEVATAKHVEQVLAHNIDVVWIGARTTVNPFSTQELADALRGTDVTVFVKNPMVPDVKLWQGAVERIINAGIRNVGLIHRGFSSYGSEFRNNPMWHVAIEMRRRMADIPMLCDPSHICGCRDKIESIINEANDLNYSGLMVECHANPDEALSDSEQQLTPEQFLEMLNRVLWRKQNFSSEKGAEALAMMRAEIDQIDSELITLLSRRMKISDRIGVVKRQNNVAILQSHRWNLIVERMLNQTDKLTLDGDFIVKLMEIIHLESIRRQTEIVNK
jgi:chorismate mutase